jgi:hypothetical protein
MKPLQHAQISAHRYGGHWRDWYKVHDWFDQSKKAFASMQHRFFLHSDFGCNLAERIFGEQLTVSSETVVPTVLICHDHQLEDVGRVIPLADWLPELDAAPLERASKEALRYQPTADRELLENPLEIFARRYGGTPAEYAPIIEFFDAPARFSSDERSKWVLHNSFGIFLTEEVFGAVIERDGRLISTRDLAEDLVKVRLGFIPSAAAVASRIRMRPWMVGTEVREALKSRHFDDLQTANSKEETVLR